jgi:uncharacterized protein YlzI (FlbEa/FlbD family)
MATFTKYNEVSGRVVWVNREQIVYIEQMPDGGFTNICFVDGTQLSVKEAAERVAGHGGQYGFSAADVSGAAP